MTLTYPVLPFCNTQVARTKLWDESSAIAPLRWISSLSSSGLGTPNIKEIVNIIGHVQSATSKAQWKLVSRFGLHEFSLHWCECFCSSYIARRLHWGASLPCPSLKPCFRWVFPMFVSAIRMCSRCRGGDKCSQTNIEFDSWFFKKGVKPLFTCAQTCRFHHAHLKWTFFDVDCLAKKTCWMPKKPHPTDCRSNAWCLAAVVFTQLLDGTRNWDFLLGTKLWTKGTGRPPLSFFEFDFPYFGWFLWIPICHSNCGIATMEWMVQSSPSNTPLQSIQTATIAIRLK